MIEKRIFDRTTKGTTTPPVALTLERGALRFFARTIGETNPIYLDAEAARAAGHPDILAPASYAAVVATLAGHEARRQGLPDLIEVIHGDLHRLLHGSESYTYHGPLYARDTLHVTHEITDFADIKGATLERAHITTRITHPTRGLLVETKRTLIHRLS